MVAGGVLASCLLSGGVVADSSNGVFSLSLEDLMNVTITTASKHQEEIGDAPTNVFVFSAEQLRERGYRNLEDLLRALPSIYLQKFSILGPYNTVAFRGAQGNNKFLILRDGVRISSPAGELTAISHNYPLYYAKQVEILMGPASVIYGADAFMGVINIISAKEELPGKKHISTNLSYGDDGYLYHSLHSYGSSTGNISWNLGGQVYRSQRFEFAEDFPGLYDDPTKTYGFSPTRQHHFMGELSVRDQWQFGFNYSEHSNSTDFTGRPFFSQFDTDAVETINQSMIFGRYSASLTDQLVSNVLLTAMRYELDSESNFNNFFTGGEPGYKYARSDRVSINQDLEYKLNAKHSLLGGWVYDYFENIPKGPDLPAPYRESVSPGSQGLTYNNTNLPITFFENDYYNIGGYIQDNWQINRDWRLVTGVRYDDNSLYGANVNPSIAAIYREAKNSVKLLYREGFLAPAPDQVSTSFGSFTGAQNTSGEWLSSGFARFRVPNRNLNPEEVKTWEVSYTRWLNQDSYVKVSPYHSRVENVILLKNDEVADQAIPGADLQLTNKFVNGGESEVYGLDISLENRFVFQRFIIKSWIYLSYTDGSLDGVFEETELPMTASYKASLGATITYKNALITPQIYWVGETYANRTTVSEPNQLVTVPSYTVMDVHAELEIKKNTHITLDIHNLLDEKYSNAPFPPAFIGLAEAPQPGRMIALGLTYQF